MDGREGGRRGMLGGVMEWNGKKMKREEGKVKREKVEFEWKGGRERRKVRWSEGMEWKENEEERKGRARGGVWMKRGEGEREGEEL